MISNIVVVDDNEETLETICWMTRNMKLGEVTGYNNASESLAALKSGNVDLVLCDWNMPDVSGLDLLKSLREAGIRTPFIMVTARNDLDSVLEARKHGVDLYISKPFSTEELQEKVAWVRAHHAHKMGIS